MTVATIILAASGAAALADTEGVPVVRLLADVAWSGVATPVVICSPDPDGSVAAALTGSEATLLTESAGAVGPVEQLGLAIAAAARLVAGTDAAILWPARMAWVDAGTVTTLIAAHGQQRGAVILPAWRGVTGQPVLVPLIHLDALRSLATDVALDDLPAALEATGVPLLVLETGDPGVTHDASLPRGEMPPYEGPPEPPDAHAHEWGDEIAR
jgi:CTP:molybdopterin cytidylyltransferase MocA